MFIKQKDMGIIKGGQVLLLYIKLTALLLAGVAWMVYSGIENRRLDNSAKELKRQWIVLRKQLEKDER